MCNYEFYYAKLLYLISPREKNKVESIKFYVHKRIYEFHDGAVKVITNEMFVLGTYFCRSSDKI